MVAYSFHHIFAPQVAALTKRQTIRADRRRHARPGEPVQLYQGMRTRQCRKLVDHDPVCISIKPVVIDISNMIDDLVASVVIDGQALHRDEIEAFAAADGFAPLDFGLRRGAFFGRPIRCYASARSNMGEYWLSAHGLGRFEGVLVEWTPA